MRCCGYHGGFHNQTAMPRIQLAPAARYPFATEMQIYISHVNQGGHLDNAQLLTLVSEARVRFFTWLGYFEFDVEGHFIVVGDIVAQYKSEGFHGETMRVEMTPADFNKYGFDLQFRMSDQATGREVALGKIGIVFLSKDHRKVSLIPAAFMERTSRL
jgi:acyl-CoA thioester hydrolase